MFSTENHRFFFVFFTFLFPFFFFSILGVSVCNNKADFKPKSVVCEKKSNNTKKSCPIKNVGQDFFISVELFDTVCEFCGFDRVFKKHGHGHGTYAAGDGRYICRDGFG